MKIAAIMPCRGRAEQTVRNVRRLLATAQGAPVEWQLICMIDRDQAVNDALSQADLPVWRMATTNKGYWHALQQATDYWHEFTHIVNLANDLIPVGPWLQRGVEAYQELFGGANDYGMVGFNGDGHGVDHSCHFLIDRDLLTYIGGYPTWYDHNFGDTELCQRVTALGFYAKAPWAILAHDHPYFGGADDQVYAEGRAHAERDQVLYEARRRQGWPTTNR